MKTNFYWVVLLLVSALFVQSCDSDDDDNLAEYDDGV